MLRTQFGLELCCDLACCLCLQGSRFENGISRLSGAISELMPELQRRSTARDLCADEEVLNGRDCLGELYVGFHLLRPHLAMRVFNMRYHYSSD